ncbi:MAG: SDR family NAD(P)-dependent oxidoreductase [Nitrospinota bacterium]|jgi:short-subunit dehydrogenase|nr:SDR family NAD(P)-dependent oxidoreductase [Nitrospinota bacterium]MDP7168583.1 SDR family NAD(P)-dependent oxidoreductase [Nitrospinota bacterium]MDP7371922.1 SDR family NAD(P)-dependent oxidoreductase [Nitrospinota bacterium]MDP7661907.1 SDR family NAD(P)-dependent oxidoreductase [Nitrospinota bacterium]
MTDYFITGASSGLGKALTRELCRRGNRVWGIARRVTMLEELAGELGENRFFYSRCDVTRSGDVQLTAQEMEESNYKPSVIILNAGVALETPGADFKFDEYKKTININLFGALSWVEIFLPAFKLLGGGQFVAISSIASFRGYSRRVAYCSSKAALSRSFESLRGQYAKKGIAFTTIHLGLTATGMGAKVRSPLQIKEKQAVTKIIAAIERRCHSISIPRVARLVVEGLRIFSDPVLSQLLEKIVKNPGKTGGN